jgi:hypothetical protein
MTRNITKKDILYILIIVLLAFAIFGLEPLGGNNVLYIPYIEKLQNPSLFPKDILFDAFRYHLSLFYNLAICIVNLFKISISDLFTVLCFIVFFSIAILSFLTAQLLFHNKKISYLFLIFLMGLKYSLAYEAIGINLQQVTQTTFALSIALYAIFLFIKNKYYLSFFVLGLMANIQPIITLQLILVFTFSHLILRNNKHIHMVNLKQIIIQFFWTFLGSLPIIIWVFVLKKQSVLSANWFSYAPEWFEIVKLRIAHHFLPSKWGFTCWFLGFVFFSIFLSAILWKKNKTGLGNKDKTIISIMLGFIPVFFLGSIGEMVPIPLILLVEIFRVFVFYNFFCLLYGSYLTYELLSANNLKKKFIGLILGYYLFLPTSALYNLNLLKPVMLGPLVVLLIYIFIVSLNQKIKMNQLVLKRIYVGIFVLFLIVSSLRRLYLNYKNWGFFTLDNSNNIEWKETQLWAKNNTSIDTLFIIPPEMYGFRIYSQRSILGSFKDGASMLFHPYLYKEWAVRMTDLGIEKEMAKGAFLFGYKEINDLSLIKRLTEKYQADYLVSVYPDLALTKVYQNKQYTIYKLK